MSAPTQDPGSSGEPKNEEPAGQPEGDNKPATEPQDNALAQRLRKSEKALAQATKQIEQFQKAADDKAKAEMSDLERHQAENQDLKSKLDQANARFVETAKRNALKLALRDAKAKSVDAAMKLADLTGVEVDEDGNVTGAEDAVKKLAKEFDFLFGSDPPPMPPVNRGGGNPSGGPPKADPKDYRHLKGAEWADFQRKVQRGEIQI